MPPETAIAAAPASTAPLHATGSRAWWPWLKRGASLAFVGLVIWLLVSQARNIDWAEVLTALQDYPPSAAIGAVALAVCSFTLYSCFDLLGRHYTGHRLSTPTVMTTTFVSYVFNLNLGSIVGGVALRYRLYSRLGLANGTITRIMSISMLSNWIGYVMLAGFVFSLFPPALPETWDIDQIGLRIVGLILLAAAGAYLGFCAWSSRRVLRLRGHEIELPSFRLAALQLIMGAANWMTMAGIVFVLLQHQVPYVAVLSVLLIAAIAGVITHIPAGLGVLEAVFVALLSGYMPQGELLAGLVAYRVVYYLAPLAIASATYIGIEAHARKLSRAAAARLANFPS